ncbi:MAG TPA: TPM domain-containing protein [Burkholderiaceae bacterium]|nr:TPM domain-containing protein [Burkholderiaceae bacterium]
MSTNRLARWLRHSTKSPQSVNRAFPTSVLQRIQNEIAEGERIHSGEIRFAVEAALPWSYLRRDAPARERAEMVFAKLRVWDTEDNNGVLIYVELADQRIEIVSDRGITRYVPNTRWEEISRMMRERFRVGEFEAGSIAGVRAVSAVLAEHFRLADGARNPNQLSDAPTVL